jgi:hypothetical protein
LPTQVKDNVANSSDNTYVKRVQKHLNDREERVDSIKTKLFFNEAVKSFDLECWMLTNLLQSRPRADTNRSGRFRALRPDLSLATSQKLIEARGSTRSSFVDTGRATKGALPPSGRGVYRWKKEGAGLLRLQRLLHASRVTSDRSVEQ